MADNVNVKLVGSMNLAKLLEAGIMTIQGTTCAKRCFVSPLEENDSYVKVEEKTARDGTKYVDRKYCIGVEIYELREPDQYGNTHYMKLSTSKQFINSHTQEEVDARNHIYLGNLKLVVIPSGNQASTVDAPVAQAVTREDDDLSF